MDLLDLGVVILLVAILASRILTERATRRLSDRDKTALVDGFSRERALGLLPLIVMFALFWLIRVRFPEHVAVASPIFLAAIGGYLGVLHVRAHRKLRAINLPEAYVRAWTVARVVQYGGFLLFIGCLSFSMAS